MAVTKTNRNPGLSTFDFHEAVEGILRTLKRDRDRQILSRRFGLGLERRQTLEKIGQDFGITRERVRQIEKAAITKLVANQPQAVTQANQLLIDYLESEGKVCSFTEVANRLGASNNGDQAYVLLLAALSPDVEVIEEDDDLQTGLAVLPVYNRAAVKKLSQELLQTIAQIGKPVSIGEIIKHMPSQPSPKIAANIARITTGAAQLDGTWGLAAWPEVNPRSIRDKTYLVLRRHTKPLHFSDIAGRIQQLGSGKQDVTTQAVHNELIKDGRFILIGRGIYALAEWGYTPGTVADIIVGVLRDQQPLHKDEIVRRVLEKRQVKTSTIVLNLQEKNQFIRVAKATYKLKDA